MGCFKEIYIEQMNCDTNEITQRLAQLARGHYEVDPHSVETLLSEEGDEFTLSLFQSPEDFLFQRMSTQLLS